MWEKPTGDLGKDLMSADSIVPIFAKMRAIFMSRASRKPWPSCMNASLSPKRLWPGSPA